MKYPELKMSLEVQPLMNSVHEWLSQELEQHGIDSAVYARYIISLLQEGSEPERQEREDPWDCGKKAVRDKKVEKRPTSRDREDPRKCNALDTLLPLTESKNEMITLVDKLINKLKEVSKEGAVFRPLHVELQREEPLEPADPAEQYYAAFPALPGETTPAVSPSAEGANIWYRKPLASQLAGETHEKQDTHPNGIGSEATDTLSGKKGALEDHSSAKKGRSTSSDRQGMVDHRPCKNGKKKNSPPGKKRLLRREMYEKRRDVINRLECRYGFAQNYGPNLAATQNDHVKEEKCIQIEGFIKGILFRRRQATTTHPPGAPQPRWQQNPSPELEENREWYLKPLQEIIVTPSLPTQRLYERNSSPPTFLSLQDTSVCRLGHEEVALDDGLSLAEHADDKFSHPSTLTEAQEQKLYEALSTLPPSKFDNDSGKDSAVVSDGESCLSSGEEDQSTQKESSGENHIDHPEASRLLKSLIKNHLIREAIQQDEDDSSREPSVDSQDDEPIFHMEMDEDETVPEEQPVGETPAGTSTAPDTSMGQLDAEPPLSSGYAGLPGIKPFQGETFSAVPPESRRSISGAEKDFESSSKGLLSAAEGHLFHVTNLLHVEKAILGDGDDGSRSLPSPPGGDVSLGALLRSDSRDSFSSGESFPEDATSFPTPLTVPSDDESTWSSDSVFGLRNLASKLVSDSSSRPDEPGYCYDLDDEIQIGMLADGSDPQEHHLFFKHLHTRLNERAKNSANGADSTSFPTSSIEPIQNLELFPSRNPATIPFKLPHSSSLASHELDVQPSSASGSLFHCDPSDNSWTPLADSRPALWNREGFTADVASPFTEKNPSHFGAISRTGRLCWSSWPIQSHLTSSFKLKSEARNPEPNYVLFPGIAKTEEVNNNVWRSQLRYDRSVSEGDLHWLRGSSGHGGHAQYKVYELIPSKDSAFRPYDQGSRSLPHVRSTPNMKFNFSDKKKEQEGLELSSPVESLYMSSRTHFRPIQTPPGTPEEFRPQDLFGGYASRDSQYQRYRDPEEPATLPDEFQPKFKLQKNRDKYIQTSLEDKEETLVMATPTATASMTFYDPFTTMERHCNPVDLSHDATNVLGSLCLENHGAHNLLDLKEVPAEPWLHRNDGKQSSGNEPGLAASKPSLWHTELGKDFTSDSSIWSTSYEFDPDVQASASCSNPLPSPPLPPLNGVETLPEPSAQTLPMPLPLEEPHMGLAAEGESCFIFPSFVPACQVVPEPQHVSSEVIQNDIYSSKFAPIPDEAVYSSDLERQWQSETSMTRQSKSLLTRTKSAKTTIKKPCSFYLEGKCRRPDCRYSHDLSRTTCCFWEKGNCFKGTDCPFLHGFPSDVRATPSPEVAEAMPEFSELNFPVLGQERSVAPPARGNLEKAAAAQVVEAPPALNGKKNQRCVFASKHNPLFTAKIIDAS